MIAGVSPLHFLYNKGKKVWPIGRKILQYAPNAKKIHPHQVNFYTMIYFDFLSDVRIFYSDGCNSFTLEIHPEMYGLLMQYSYFDLAVKRRAINSDYFYTIIESRDFL